MCKQREAFFTAFNCLIAFTNQKKCAQQDLSDDAPNWSTHLPSGLEYHSFACNFTSFKGATDILLVGRKSIIVVLCRTLTNDDTERAKDSGIIVAEVYANPR